MLIPEHDRARIDQVAGRVGMTGAAVVSLQGGSRNRCYRLSRAGRELVVRIAGAHDDAYAVARAAESLAQRAAAESGLAPRLWLEEPELGVVVMDYLPGAVLSRAEARSVGGACRVGHWLRRLHSTPLPPALRRVDFVSSLEHYCASLGRDVVEAALLERARSIGKQVRAGTAPVLCHHDLHHLNLIDSPVGLVAIDWEYAGAGEAIMDYAGFAAYHDLDEAAVTALLRAGGGDGALTAEMLVAARWLFEAVWWAWLELRRSLEADEPAELAATRSRLAIRLGLSAA